MQYEPLSHTSRVEKAIVLTNRIIVKALQSDRGDSIRVMNVADLKNMLKSVFNGVYNKLAVDAQRAYDCAVDKYELDQDCIVVVQDENFKPRPDVEIEEEVTAYFEINGKLQYRELMVAPVIVLQGDDESLGRLMQQNESGSLSMRYNPYSLAERLERADIITNTEIIIDCKREEWYDIRAMNHAEFKRMRKDIFSFYYHQLVAEAEAGFEQACKDYNAERDGIKNNPRKTFKPKTKFEIDKEIKAYFKSKERHINRTNNGRIH